MWEGGRGTVVGGAAVRVGRVCDPVDRAAIVAGHHQQRPLPHPRLWQHRYLSDQRHATLKSWTVSKSYALERQRHVVDRLVP